MSTEVRDIALDATDIWPDYRPTRLIESPGLAQAANVRRVLVKLESERPLGNFKALGGMVAGLRALARATGVLRLRDLPGGTRQLPTLVCASAGNHGLAVAAAARWAGATATIYLSEHVNRARAARIEALGARIVWTAGTYDDAVQQAASSGGLVIGDTSANPDDPAVRDVMDGYGLIARELAAQLEGDVTHLFVQAGVGGLAAALAQGVRPLMQTPRRVVVVEPDSAACVARALSARRPVRIAGELRTRAEMLSCGLASAPALRVLLENEVESITVTDDELEMAGDRLQTTPSGAAGLAGLLQASSRADLRRRYQLGEDSSVLLVVTEGNLPSMATIFGTS